MTLSWNLTEQTLPFEQYLPKKMGEMQTQYQEAVKPENCVDRAVSKTAGNYLAGAASLVAGPAISFGATALFGPVGGVAAPFIASAILPYLQQGARDVSVAASKQFQSQIGIGGKSNNALGDAFEIVDGESIPVVENTPAQETESYASKAVRMGSEGLFYTTLAGLTQPSITYALSKILASGGLASVAGHVGSTMAVPFLGPIAGDVGVALAGATVKGAHYTWEKLKDRLQSEPKKDDGEIIPKEEAEKMNDFLAIFNKEDDGEIISEEEAEKMNDFLAIFNPEEELIG